jgi:hypothetical protein
MFQEYYYQITQRKFSILWEEWPKKLDLAIIIRNFDQSNFEVQKEALVQI